MRKILPLFLQIPIWISASLLGAHVPDIDELMKVASPSSPVISPDGKWVVYSITLPDFEENAFVSQLHLVSTSGGEPRQLTRGKNSARSPHWSPDSKWLTFLRSVEGKSQIFAMRPEGGEAFQISDSKTSVSSFDWSPDGYWIALLAETPKEESLERREEVLGDFHIVREDYAYTHIWTLAAQEALEEPAQPLQRTQRLDLHVTDFEWAPNSREIVFTGTRTPDLVNRDTADVYRLSLDGNRIQPLVEQAGPDTGAVYSPDGRRLVFSTYMGQEHYYASNSELALIPLEGGSPRVLTSSFDENPNLLEWNQNGIYFAASQKTASHLFLLSPDSGRIQRVTGPDQAMLSSFSFSADGQQMAYLAQTPETLPEVYVSDADQNSPRQLTEATQGIRDFTLGTRELISWSSQDGTRIEGILIKPRDFDPSRKYALLCVIHGGPTGIDRPAMLARGRSYYPVDIWAARGALILLVNYRGSAGYGEAFRKLNIRNLGVGDAWDVLSGVQSLIDKGWVDPARIGCMGWSQGGYISAFLTTTSDRFAAISVGAGISNWATYYYNTDITPFTINYLGDDPADDPEIYRKTSPMSYILDAQTPTLIQHGEFDKRVPTPNGYELRQGLEDRGVPVEMIVYRGFGHGISKPREMRAVMRHNLEWFGHYIFGDPAPNFTHPDLPEKTASQP